MAVTVNPASFRSARISALASPRCCVVAENGKRGSMKAADLIHKDDSSEQGPARAEQGPAYLGNHTPQYKDFARNFVMPRQNVWHLHGDPKGSEQFGQHVNARINATPTGDGMTPGEKVPQ
jgi:hypothetical protein